MGVEMIALKFKSAFAVLLIASFIAANGAEAGGPDFKAKMGLVAEETRKKFTSTNPKCPGGNPATGQFDKSGQDKLEALRKKVGAAVKKAVDEAKKKAPLLRPRKIYHIETMAAGEEVGKQFSTEAKIWGNCGEMTRWKYYEFFNSLKDIKMMIVGWNDNTSVWQAIWGVENNSHTFMLIKCKNKNGDDEIYAFDAWIGMGLMIGPVTLKTDTDGSMKMTNASGETFEGYDRSFTPRGPWQATPTS